MSKIPTIRFFRRFLYAGTVVVLSTGYLLAQNSGSSFQIPTSNQSSSNSSGQFNSLPFRAVNQPKKQSFQNVAAKPASSSRPTQWEPGQPNGQAQTAQENSSQFGFSSPNRVIATPASFGNTPANSNAQSSSQEKQVSHPMPKYVDLENCAVNFIDNILLPAKESGVIESLTVKEGDFIPAGTVIGKIDDELYQALLEQAKLRLEIATEVAEDMISIKAAEKKFIVASIEAKKTSDLADKGSKSETDRLMADYQKEIALLERVKAVNDKEQAEREKRLEEAKLREVQTHIREHVLQSDFDAYVIKIGKKPQEYVRMGDEVMRIARMDRLWVQGTVDITSLNPDEVLGRTVTVTVDRARGEKETFEGKITNVGLERQGLTRYMVKAEVVNRPVGNHWVLQPGSEVSMRIHLDLAPKQDGKFEAAARSN